MLRMTKNVMFGNLGSTTSLALSFTFILNVRFKRFICSVLIHSINKSHFNNRNKFFPHQYIQIVKDIGDWEIEYII